MEQQSIPSSVQKILNNPAQAQLFLKALQQEQTKRRLQKALTRPKNDDELWLWIRDVLGYRIARTVTAEDHRPPFEFISDFFFGREDSGLVWACRGAGKTRCFAIIYLLCGIFKENFSMAHIAGSEDQSRRGYAYFAGDPAKEGEAGFIRGHPFDTMLASEPMVSKTTLKNGSRLEMRTGGSQKAVSGLHPNMLGIDELDHMDMGTLDTALQAPMSLGIYRSQVMMGSSQYYSFGTLQTLLDGAEERGTKVYKFDLFDIMQSCGYSYPDQCSHCPFYIWNNPFTGEEEELCGGRGTRSDGHYSYRDALKKLAATQDLEYFALQNLLIRGVSQGLVYSTFNYERHVEPFPPSGADISQWKLFAGVDIRGSGRIIVLAEAPGILQSGKHMRWVIDEWVDDHTTPSRMISAAYEMKSRAFEKYELPIDVFWIELPSADYTMDWVKAGLPARTIPKDFKNVRYRIGQVRDALFDASGNISLKVDPHCKNLIYAMSKGYYCKRSKSDGSFDRDTPDENSDSHSPDALGYAYVGGPVINVSRRLPAHEKRSGWWDVGTSKWAPY